MVRSKSNCFIYAAKKFLSEGGSILVRSSNSNRCIPHFMHRSKEGIVTHWQPIYRFYGWKALFAKLWFEGYIKKGD